MAARVLFVGRMLPMPHSNGSATHVRDFLAFLGAAGCETRFLHLARPYVPPEVAALVPMVSPGDPGGDGEWPSHWDAPVTASERAVFAQAVAAFRPDAVVCDYDWLADVFDALPEGADVRRVIFLHDLRIRILAASAAMGIPNAQAWDEAREGALLRKADAVLVLQDEDAAACRRMAPATQVVRIGISVQPVARDADREVAGRLLYVGSRTPENLVALAGFLADSWPRVLDAVPHATLAVCGGVGEFFAGPDAIVALSEGMIVTGRIDDLQPHYEAAQVVIVPHRMQGGMKLKFVDALAHGRAGVADRCGIDGMPEAENRCVLVADAADAFADHVVRLLGDPVLRRLMEAGARRLAAERLSPQACYGAALAVIAPEG